MLSSSWKVINLLIVILNIGDVILSIRPSMHIESNTGAPFKDNSTYRIGRGRNYNLICVVFSNPPSKITWYFKFLSREGDLPRGNYWQLIPDTVRMNRYKKLVRITDWGFYKCHAKNQSGETSITIRVVKRQEKIKLKILPVNKNSYSPYRRVYVGSDADFICFAWNSKTGEFVKGLKYTWRFQHSKCSDIAEEMTIVNNILRLKSVKKGKSQRIECETFYQSDDYGHSVEIIPMSRSVPVTMRLTNLLTGEQTLMNSDPEKMELILPSNKSDVKVLCGASGTPKPRFIRWKLCIVKKCTFGHSLTTKNNILRLKEISEDNKHVRCEAQNTVTFLNGTWKVVNVYKDIFINVLYPPEILKDVHGLKKLPGKNKYEVEKNEEMILICDNNDKSFPKPTITWTRDGGAVPSVAIEYDLFRGRALKIRISDLRAFMSGKYVCEASNSSGKDTKTFNVMIPPGLNKNIRL